jgi:L-lactate dehydrogenase complex protein LldG
MPQGRAEMSQREAILGKVRAGLAGNGSDAARRAAIEKRLGSPLRHLVPARTLAKPPHVLAQLLRAYLEGQTASVIEVASSDQVPSAIGDYLRANNLPACLRAGLDSELVMLPWEREPALEIRRGRADAADQVGLTRALAGVAETGTLILASGPDNPVTLNFLPETSIVMLSAKDIVGCYEDAWTKLRERFGRNLPRTVNMISGPSCTGDIGSSIIRGAHGPRRMCVIVVAE